MLPSDRTDLRRRHVATKQHVNTNPGFFSKYNIQSDIVQIDSARKPTTPLCDRISKDLVEQSQETVCSSPINSVCKQQTYNYWQKLALKDLAKFGFTEKMLLDLNIADHDFDSWLLYGLKILVHRCDSVIEQKISLPDALDLMKRLYICKGFGVGDNIKRANVFACDSYWYISALIKFESQGLTVEKLLEVHDFGHTSYFVLQSLVEDKKASIDDVLATLKKLSFQELLTLDYSLQRENCLLVQKQKLSQKSNDFNNDTSLSSALTLG